MTTVKETIQLRKPVKDTLTPHRLSVAILIKEFCSIRERTEVPRTLTRDFCVLALQLIQSPDLTFEELKNILSSEDYAFEEELLLRKFDETVNNICSGIAGRHLEDTVDAIGQLMVSENNLVAKDGCVNKNSVVGYFLRRLVIYFDKLTFYEVTRFLSSYKAYTTLNVTSLTTDSTKLNSTLSSKLKFFNDDFHFNRDWSRRQAELFIATQSSLIVNNEEKAFNPSEMNIHIKNLLKSNPDLAEAHFLSYLNYLRVKEFSCAIDSLHHCFDKSTNIDAKGTNEEKTKSYRYAALNLAILHYQFGHKEEAICALKEAIKMAQEVSDNVCLQHSLSWLYCLTQNNRHKLMEHSILKSIDLNLSYIMSLGVQSFVQYAGITMGSPKQVFDTITKSDIINYQHNHRDLISSSYSQKSAIWLFYGKTEMSSLWSQLLLYLNNDNTYLNKTHYGESYCQTLCNMAGQLHLEGEYSLSNCILAHCKERFPNEPISETWILCEKILSFERALYHGNLQEAENIAIKMAVIDKWESRLRIAELLIHSRNYDKAHGIVNEILSKCKDGSKKFRMDVQVRAMILLSDIQIATSFSNSMIPGILGLLNSTLAYANDYHLQYLASLAQLHIANVQLMLGMSGQAAIMLDKCLVQILAHGGCYDRARALLFYVKCKVVQAKNETSEDRKAIILEMAKMLGKVKENFGKVEAHYRVKDTVHLQALLYNELEMVKERNQSAMEFRLLDEEHPTYNPKTLLTFL